MPVVLGAGTRLFDKAASPNVSLRPAAAINSPQATHLTYVVEQAAAAQREVLHFGGGGPQTQAGLGGFKVSLDAIGGLRRQTMKAGGIPESIAVSDPEREEIIDNLLPTTLLGRAATLADVGNVAAWAASDQVHDHRHRDQHLLRCDRRLGGNAVNLRQVIAHLAGLTVGGTLLLWDGADQESGRLVQKVVESDTAEAIKGCDS